MLSIYKKRLEEETTAPHKSRNHGGKKKFLSCDPLEGAKGENPKQKAAEQSTTQKPPQKKKKKKKTNKEATEMGSARVKAFKRSKKHQHAPQRKNTTLLYLKNRREP